MASPKEVIDEPESENREEQERWTMVQCARWLLVEGRITPAERVLLESVTTAFDWVAPASLGEGVAF